MIEINELINNVTLSESYYETCEQIMRKFELNKKLVSSYNKSYKSKSSTYEISPEKYQQVAIIFCLLAVKFKDIRFYNTALKIRDLIDLKIPKIEVIAIYG